MIFVFGSNEAGRHGAGAARDAVRYWGAKEGQGFGPQGAAFAIPTKDWRLAALAPRQILGYVERFLDYARLHAELEFQVTAIGTGLAGYPHVSMAELFHDAPPNCFFDERWGAYLRIGTPLWGRWT